MSYLQQFPVPSLCHTQAEMSRIHMMNEAVTSDIVSLGVPNIVEHKIEGTHLYYSRISKFLLLDWIINEPSSFERREPQDQRPRTLQLVCSGRYRIERQLGTVSDVHQDSVQVARGQTKASNFPINILVLHRAETVVNGCAVLQVEGSTVILTSDPLTSTTREEREDTITSVGMARDRLRHGRS